MAAESISLCDDPCEEPTRAVEVCFFCRGDASTSCCAQRIEWIRLHGNKAPFGVHCPQEHVDAGERHLCTMRLTSWKDGALVEEPCSGLAAGTIVGGRVCRPCGEALEHSAGGLDVTWDDGEKR